MSDNFFGKLGDWKDFERLSADLLEAEGYRIFSEPYVDRSGADLIAIKEYRSHDDEVISVRWRVQCKHFAVSGKRFGRKEAEETLYSYAAARRAGEGLLILVSTDYSEEAKGVLDRFLENHSDAHIDLWNQRKLRARLERHPDILVRHKLSRSDTDYMAVFTGLSEKQCSVLIISDQSALAHDLTAVFQGLSFKITFLPFWNYRSSAGAALLLASLRERYDLIVVFLGDSFGLPLPPSVVRSLVHFNQAGSALLLFPFIAWSMNKGLYSELSDTVPVRLIELEPSNYMERLVTTSDQLLAGDFRPLLLADSFAEDQYTELDPADGETEFTNGISGPFGLSHSYEGLTLAIGARCVWADTKGNPFVSVRDSAQGRICYLNTCCHSCMTTVPVISPLRASPPFAVLVKNVLNWLLEKQ